MNIKMQRFKNTFLSLIAIAILIGCSAAPMPTIAQGSDGDKSNELADIRAQQDLNQEDCFAISVLSNRESCFALTKNECALGDLKCEPYKNMYFANKKLESTLKKIETLISEVYKSYLADDPGYVNDAVLHSKESDQSWRKYRDSDCLLEQYANSMSRREIDDIAEVCRVSKTEKRIFELKKIVIVLESNRGS